MTKEADSSAVVEVSDVKVHFGAVKALDGVTIRIAAGECVGLVGHNGAGKSTIVNIINGGLTPHSGTVSCSGTEIERYGIAASTVRTHIKSLFAKTGARRQKDLVKLLLSTPPINLKPL